MFKMLLLLVLLLGAGCSGAGSAAPARHGVIDLAAIDPVRLDGEWEFYWNRLLSPQDFAGHSPPSADGFLSLPHSWTGFEYNGEALRGAGRATLRLRILPGPGMRELALQIGLVNSAYRLWADGVLIAENGVLGANADEETPIRSFQRARLRLEGRPIDLVLQVTNHHDREGGVLSPLLLGTADSLAAAELRQRGLTMFSVGSLMVMGIYHVFLYVFRTKNAAPLYFGIYCLLWMVFSLTNNANGWPIRMFFGDLPFRLLNRIDLICVVVSVPVLYSFLRTLYPDEFPLLLQHGAWIVAAAFLAPGLVASTMTFTSIISAFYLFCIVLIGAMMFMLVLAIRRKREGALYILLGFSGLGVVSVNDMLYDLQIVHTVYLMEAGMLGFILFQACALSLRYARAFSSVENLSGELTDKNVALEREIGERGRLEREIVNTSEEERRRISRELHDGLCQKLTGARLHFSVLQRQLAGADRDSPELASVSSLLEESVNQAYILSRGLWPVENDPHGKSPSLEELALRLAGSGGIAVEFAQQRGCEPCTNGAMIQIYRIAQEAITNAVKHARPGRIAVGLDCTDRKRIVLTVEDDGIGRRAAAETHGGLGISIMSYRARVIGGTLEISDAADGGTRVTCTVPCSENPARAAGQEGAAA